MKILDRLIGRTAHRARNTRRHRRERDVRLADLAVTTEERAEAVERALAYDPDAAEVRRLIRERADALLAAVEEIDGFVAAIDGRVVPLDSVITDCPVHPDGTRRHDQPEWECCTFDSTGPGWFGTLTRARDGAALTYDRIPPSPTPKAPWNGYSTSGNHIAPASPPYGTFLAVGFPPGIHLTVGESIEAVTPTTPLPVGTRVVTIRESWDAVPVGSRGTVTQPPPLLAVAFDHDPEGDGTGSWAMFGHQLAVLHEPA